MATDDPDRPDTGAGPDAGAGASTCTPCRGTGRLISGLGGTPHEVTCPWCEGSGHRIPGLNAQEHPAEGSPGEGDPAGPGAAEPTP